MSISLILSLVPNNFVFYPSIELKKFQQLIFKILTFFLNFTWSFLVVSWYLLLLYYFLFHLILYLLSGNDNIWSTYYLYLLFFYLLFLMILVQSGILFCILNYLWLWHHFWLFICQILSEQNFCCFSWEPGILLSWDHFSPL